MSDRLKLRSAKIVLLSWSGLTWAEPGRPNTQPSSTFLLASVSKIFTEAAIQSLADAELLDLNMTPWTYFGGYPWQGTPLNDSRMENITIQQLLDHYAGFNLSFDAGDITYGMREVSQSLNKSSPPNISECVYYLRDFALHTNPGENYSYSNVGYLVLSAVVETITKLPYLDFIHAKISSDVQLWHTNASYHTTDIVTQETWQTGQSAVTPSIYGEEIAAI